jgi:hypothetical protein
MLCHVHLHQWGNICYSCIWMRHRLLETTHWYLLPIWHCGMILKLTLTIIIKMVDWGKTKQHNIPKYMCEDFLKQDFEWAQEWLWCLNNVKVNTIESTLKVLDFASKKRNRSNALMRFSILMGLRVLGWIPMEVANLIRICLLQEMFIGETSFTCWTIFCNKSTCILLGPFESINS